MAGRWFCFYTFEEGTDIDEMFRRQVLRFVLLLLLICGSVEPMVRAASPAPPRRYDISWTATIPATSHGYGVALLPSASTAAVVVADWRTPNLPGALGVGFDTYDPPTEDPFNADRNINGRPQREVSLHWNGVEVARRLSPVEIQGAAAHTIRLTVAFVVGGAEVGVRIDDTAIYDHYFVPDVPPYAAHFASGGDAVIDGVQFDASGAAAVPTHFRVRAFDHLLNDAGHHNGAATVDFPTSNARVGRVICTLTLDKTPHGLDRWDRVASLYLYDEKGTRFEVLRYITPYHKAWQWKADVTDLLPLLTGRRKMELVCETYGAGWAVSVDFDFYQGALPWRPYRVVPLWSTTAVIGQADKPVASQIPPQTVRIDPDARRVAVRLCVTGHGQAPNTDDAAEFISLWRKLSVGNTVVTDTLWKTDNYLNPCRPQGGTWKYDRAGWGPGTVVAPWLVDVTASAPPGADATFRYEIQPYVDRTPDNGNPARHIVEAQIVYYRQENAVKTRKAASARVEWPAKRNNPTVDAHRGTG